MYRAANLHRHIPSSFHPSVRIFPLTTPEPLTFWFTTLELVVPWRYRGEKCICTTSIDIDRMNLVNFLSIYGLSMSSWELTLDAFCGARPSVFQASCQESTNREVALRPS